MTVPVCSGNCCILEGYFLVSAYKCGNWNVALKLDQIPRHSFALLLALGTVGIMLILSLERT